MAFSSLKEILGALKLKNKALSTRLDEASLFTAWPEIVGDAIAKHAKPQSIRQGKLVIAVSHPVWKTELHHSKEMILNKIKAHFEKSPGLNPPLVKDLYFVDQRTLAQ